MHTYKDWKNANYPGNMTVMFLDWLLKGCPRCDCKEWEITNDGWCYCTECNSGYSTCGIWTNAPLSFYDKNGFHCFMCHGYGKRNNELCEDCHGRITQPETHETRGDTP